MHLQDAWGRIIQLLSTAPKTEREREREAGRTGLSPVRHDRRKPAHLGRPSPGMQSSGMTDGVHAMETVFLTPERLSSGVLLLSSQIRVEG